MTRYMIMANDYPLQLLPADWTEEQAYKLRKEYQKHEENRQKTELSPWIFYHIQTVDESKEFRPYL